MPGRSMPAGRELARNWDAVLGRLQLVVPERQFRTWLRDTRATEAGTGTLTVQVKTQFHADWLREHLEDEITSMAAEQFGSPLRLCLVPRVTEDSAPALFAPGPAQPAATHELGIFGRMTPGYTFARYQIAEGNRLAVEAANALADGDSWRPTPLVVHGTPGIGKSHLLQAVAWRAREQNRRVVCLSWPDFVGQFVGSLRGGEVERFKEQVRTADLLLIDDLRDAATAPKSVEELSAAIDAIRSGQGAILVSAELPPKELGLPQRLVSRLEEGLVVEVQAFNSDERRRFAEWRSRESGATLPEWALTRLAQFPAQSVRVLAGAINAAIGLQRTGRLDEARLDAALTQLILEMVAPGCRDATGLIERVAAYFSVGAKDLEGRERTANLRDARAVAAAVLRHEGLSVAEVGNRLGHRAKGTVPGLIARGEAIISADPQLRGRLTG
ncbi:MAG: DnaA/Hda family protein [Dehalococcoidia bacterium]